MKKTVLFTVLVVVAMIAVAGGIRDAVDPELTAVVETLLDDSVMREYADLERTPIPPAPAPIDHAAAAAAPVATGIPTAAPYGGAFIERVYIEDGYAPLTDLDVLYGVAGPPVLLPVHRALPVDLLDDTPATFFAAWANPPLDAK
jgi:hypothetical protein